jgi:glycosyltransferase involved in cell wall biosynthesis
MLIVHRWLRTWHEQVDIYIALTEFCREKYIQGGLPAEKIVLKPNFLYPDPGRREYEEPYALFAGRFVPAKGIQTLLRAWQDMKGILLNVAGSGPLMHEIQALIQSRKLENVELLGQLAHEEILDYLKKARFLVFPSESYENFPMAIVEAFACGVPVIAGRIGAVTELIEDGHTGLLFEPGNCEDLTAKLEWACRNPDKMQAMGNEARLEFERKYTAERNYRLLMEIYQMAIERHTKTKMDRGDDLCS